MRSSCQEALVCEQTSLVGTCTYTCAHTCSPKPKHMHSPGSRPRSSKCRGGAELVWSLWVRIFEKASGGGGTREGWELGTRAWAEAAEVGFPGKGDLQTGSTLNPGQQSIPLSPLQSVTFHLSGSQPDCTWSHLGSVYIPSALAPLHMQWWF